VLHEQLRDAAFPCGAVDEELCDLRAMRLVRRERENHLNRADDPANGKRGKQQPATRFDLGGHDFECGARVLV
jgi:hypothetical protein